MNHYGEAFTESRILVGTPEWGWQCLTCGWEAIGFEDINAAESAGDEHIRNGAS